MPDVWEKLFGNGHSPLLGSGSVGSGAVAAAGTPLGRPAIPGALSARREDATAVAAQDAMQSAHASTAISNARGMLPLMLVGALKTAPYGPRLVTG